MEFTEVMKHWRRMCEHYTTDDAASCCNDCPMRDLPYDDHGCDAIFSDWAKNADWQKVADVVMKWAAEHPEKVYPTWVEWLETVGVVALNTDKGFILIKPEVKNPIPADIAEKLGIEPKGEA